jgi:hypothetical protein
MLDSISHKGAFRRFKDLVHGLGIHEEWYRYRDQALKKIAAEFLKAEGILYIDDGAGGTP